MNKTKEINVKNSLSSFDIHGICNYIKSGKASKIVVLTGAGISCSAGIPDFRSINTGLYSNLQKYNLLKPSDIFDINYFVKDPVPFFDLCPSLLPGKYQPTFIHYFCSYLARIGLLHRHYTQNIDGLERIAGVPKELLVEAHGSFYSAHCHLCKREYSYNEIRDRIDGTVLHCDDPSCEGFIKPDIVFFHEQLPKRFDILSRTDLRTCDLLIIIGTSLKVQPFGSLPGVVSDDIPRVLINNEKVASYYEEQIDIGGSINIVLPPNHRSLLRYDHSSNKRDVFIGGDCQNAIIEISKELGWYEEISKMMNK